jgi:hypothetical protein
MVIVWGSGLYGKVDEIPGVCHVATKFGHLWYIPLIPMGSWAVISKDGNGWQGAPVGWSIKSILTAWFRAAAIVGLIVGVITLIVAFADRAKPDSGDQLLGAGVILGASIAVLVGSYYTPGVGKASHAKARVLARKLGFSKEHRLMLIDVPYGVLTREDAERRIEQMRKRGDLDREDDDDWD